MKHWTTMALLSLLALWAALLAPAGALAHGSDDGPPGGPVAGSADTLARLPDGSVNVPMPAQRRLGLRTAEVQARSAAAALELPGRVVMDPNAGGRVQTLAGGQVQAGPRGLPVPGQGVRRGEVLAYVAFNANPIERANQQAQLAETRANRQLTEQRVQRLESLEGTVPRKDIEAARAQLQALAAREQAIGAAIGAREALRAPVSGVVARASVVAGQVVEPKDVLFEVVDPARVLVEASTVDAALGTRIAGAALSGLPEVRLQFLGAARALQDGALPLSFRASASGPLPLALGQPVTVVVRLRQGIEGHVLPAQAVTRNAANEPVVWVKTSAERFVPRPVRLQPLDAQNVVVTAGLEGTPRVVVQGASLIAQIR